MKPRLGPRERLLSAAQDVTREQGYGAGVDSILARADVARRSLYQHFGGKDELIAAALRVAAERDERRYQAALQAGGTDPRDRIRAVFEEVGRAVREPGYRGCRYTAADLSLLDEHPAHQVARQHKADVVGLLRCELVRAEHLQPELGALQLALLIDSMLVAGMTRPGVDVGEAVRPLVAAVLASCAPESTSSPAQRSTR